MKKIYQTPASDMIYLATADIITASLDSAEDGFDGGIVDLNPTT